MQKPITRSTWREWISKNAWGRGIGIGALLVLGLSSFLHFRENHVEIFELGETVDHYVIAQLGFEFYDEELTVILKQEAVRDVGVINKIKEEQIEKRCCELEEYLIHNQQWRQQFPQATIEQVYKIGDTLRHFLQEVRYTDSRTLQKMEKGGFSIRNYVVINALESSADAWKERAAAALLRQGYAPDEVNYLIAHFEGQEWHLEEDQNTQRLVRGVVESRFAPVYSRVEAGSYILVPGERVSSRHLAMYEAMQEALAASRFSDGPLHFLGILLIAFSFIGAALLYLRWIHPTIFHSFKQLSLLVVIVLLSLVVAKGVEYMLLQDGGDLLGKMRYPFLLPFAAILTSVLIGSEVAFFITALLAVIFSFSLAIDKELFLVINLVGAIMAILCARGLHRRKEVFGVCGKVWLASLPVVVAFALLNDGGEVRVLFEGFIGSFLSMLLMAILTVAALPVLEATFHVMTNMTLMEYMDPNHPLLRRLSVEAPGTYHHCLVMGNLAESAARAINANGLFCRVATLYHDIGKLSNPQYFTENQFGGFNVHQLLTPLESAQVIIAHVPEGEALARKYHLPQDFIDIIREHHGTTLVYYFFCKQVEQAGGDVTKVDEKQFCYAGPKPRTKESAIIMIADTVEAASRCMDETTEEGIAQMIERLVAEKAEEKQFDECQLTFEELGIVKKAILKSLLVTHHLRIKYPAR